MNKKPAGPAQRIIEIEDQIARQLKAADELRIAGGDTWIDTARQLRILKYALDLIRLPAS